MYTELNISKQMIKIKIHDVIVKLGQVCCSKYDDMLKSTFHPNLHYVYLAWKFPYLIIFNVNFQIFMKLKFEM